MKRGIHILLRYLHLKNAGVQISFKEALGMWARNILTKDMMDLLIIVSEEGLDFSVFQMTAHFLAGGNINDIVQAGIILKRNNISYNPNTLFAFDFAREGKVLQLAESFVKAKQSFPAVSLSEFVQSYIKGDDAIPH